MVRETNTGDLTADGGGEGSATGAVQIWKNPSRAGTVGILEELVLDNITGVHSRFLIYDEGTAATAAPAVVPLSFEVDAGQSVTLKRGRDFGEHRFFEGVMAQNTQAVSGGGAKVTAGMDVVR